ncbi:MAG: hypothetical protein A3F14_04445 [Gammaproteobacteria bacterium RIFCSPHIGHO2_12_FULL_43_28]|nr:MAG: hypothetical protein A3F14_04445 [Gammaproteobacteria bacterium RIFCSPHIGHO2_12_FULL_43_28]
MKIISKLFNVTVKRQMLLLIYFSVLSISLLSPIASNQYIPNSPDYAFHLVLISQAKEALANGQSFPLRIAPDLYQGFGYPIYQFYSPLVYNVVGALHKLVIPSNPWIAFKLSLWFGLVFAGVFVYRLVHRFVHSASASLLSATLYLMSPLLLVNMGARGDLSESIAICILPCVLYFSVQYHHKPSLNLFILTSLAWFSLATTHLITFIFSSLFIGVFLITLNIQMQLPLRRLAELGLAYAFAWLLALWYLAPVILLPPYLYTHYILNNPYTAGWLSPLSTLLTPSAASPMPLPGNGKLYFPFYVGLGWPMLLGIGYAIYKKILDNQVKVPVFVTPLLFLIFIAFFAAWSPINFWLFLPESFGVLQFGFRLIIQMMWMGAILFAWGINDLFQHQLDARHVAIGILLIAIANSSWIMTNQESRITLENLIERPQLSEWGTRSYVINPSTVLYDKNTTLNLLPVKETVHFCHREKAIIVCQIAISKKTTDVQLPVLYYPNMLNIKVNGKTSAYQPFPYHNETKNYFIINPMLVTLKLAPGNYEITSRFVGFALANEISLFAWSIFVLLLPLSVFNFIKRS